MPARSDDSYRDGFFCCAEGAIPLTEIRAQLYTQAEAYARAAGMRDPAVYAQWLLAQVGLAPFDGDAARDAQVMPYAQECRQTLRLEA